MAETLYTGSFCRGFEEKLKMANSKFIRRGNDAATATTVCGVVFCVFSFTYLFFYQGNLLAMEQHVLSHGITQYNKLLGAVIITLVLQLLQLGFDTVTRHCIKQPALTYLPSALLLAVISDVSPEVDSGYSLGKWVWLAPLLLILYAFVAYASASVLANNDGISHKSQACIMWENMIIMGGLMTFVCCTANSNRIFHQRMQMENLIYKKKYEEAANVIVGKTDRDSSLTMLRAYALSKTGAMAEKLFEYPLKGGSDALLPGYGAKCMLLNSEEMYRNVARPLKQSIRPLGYLQWMQKHGYVKNALRDYLLCAYLLDKRIDDFARELAKDKDLSRKHLPKHYREALVLYNHLRSNPIIVYHNDVMDADYNDMMSTIKNLTESKEKRTQTIASYENTYWFYYIYGEK